MLFREKLGAVDIRRIRKNFPHCLSAVDDLVGDINHGFYSMSSKGRILLCFVLLRQRKCLSTLH